jgi:hypothetical protein
LDMTNFMLPMLDMDLVGCSIPECYVSQFVILDGK